MLGSKKKEEAFPVNEALLNVITPMGLEIKRNSLVIGENLGKVYGAVRYPQKVDMGWLSKITNIPSTIVSVGITPIDNGSLISAISKSIVQQRGAADSAKDPLTRQRAEKAAEDGEKIMQRIDQEGETVAMMSLTVMPIAQDEANFTKVCRRVESAFNIQKCKVRTLANLQKEGFQSISPTYPANSTVDSIVSRIIPMSTFVGGFPFASSGYNDGRGYYFAKDSNGGLVILDTWERGNDRTNSSFVIMGVAGIGKSTVVKHIMLSEYMKGTKILCIDPESEYKDMCRNLNGSWLNAGGGKNGRSNLLQIRPAPRDDDDETDKLYTDEGNGMSDMALHMKTLEIEFSLYLPSLTDNNPIAPYFREHPVALCDLTKQDILAFYEKELERVKPTTVKHYHALIHGALNYAVDKNLIPSNPADRIIISKPEPFKGDYYLDSEVLNLFEVIKGHKIELVVLLTAFYGLRRSEVIGLKWSAFDFNHNCFSIRHTVTTCNVKGERVTIKKDKAKNKSSLRTYPLIPFLKERLLEAKKQQEENRKLCGRAYNKEYLGYVCVDVIGNLIKPNYVSSTFGKLLAKNNLRHIRFHDLRHTCASLLLANGVPMEQVKEWLGHSEISTTVDIYGHLQYATKKQSAAAIEQDIVAPMLQNLSAVSP